MEDSKTIEQWKVELKTKDHIFAGMVTANDYAEGKVLTKDEYENAIDIFLYGEVKAIKEEKKIKNRKEPEVLNDQQN